MFKVSIGENLKKIRKESGLNLEEFANIADIACNTLSNIETNKLNPSLNVVIKIADAFGLTLDEVVGHYVEDPKY